MKALLVPFAFAVAMVPYAVHAEGKLKVDEAIEINAPADAVWSKINNFGDLGAWHPAVKTTEIVAGKNNEKGAVRLLTLQDNGTIKEELEAYSSKQQSYSYRIIEGVLPVTDYHSTIIVKPLNATSSKVTWSGKFDGKDSTQKASDDALTAITNVYKGGLSNLKKITEIK
ncbi:hypothetical protein A7976_13810 [Methylobacillus sp. MM3]|uniref:SRPBCC family protein n=1 Tax=Methylobacillus sp. MM3 TaxID=1848039 RepID=UPI0007DED357|nr:SRPBCC family protein [Methylobacillus sp. MM3]OAJ69697.1 hypothetical protein A7976_13810 [Methylobacillus sp. MM3]